MNERCRKHTYAHSQYFFSLISSSLFFGSFCFCFYLWYWITNIVHASSNMRTHKNTKRRTFVFLPFSYFLLLHSFHQHRHARVTPLSFVYFLFSFILEISKAQSQKFFVLFFFLSVFVLCVENFWQFLLSFFFSFFFRFLVFVFFFVFFCFFFHFFIFVYFPFEAFTVSRLLKLDKNDKHEREVWGRMLNENWWSNLTRGKGKHRKRNSLGIWELRLSVTVAIISSVHSRFNIRKLCFVCVWTSTTKIKH